ncbi:MAG TPA: pyridoxal phosphate-dependent aminotransferase [Planctomycetes bacterium]|nr:pyridoxal phosphate-dependent aminotransferase [Planctomycetota bacterium]
MILRVNIEPTDTLSPTRSALREVPFMGVIWVVAEAMKLGFRNGDPDWCNLGQGQPEVGELEGAPPRLTTIELEPQDHAYGPVGGSEELCSVVAAHQNRLFREGASSLYTAANVSVASGGRLALSRLFAALGSTRLGYQVPDYTAYEDMIAAQRHRIEPIAFVTDEEHGFALDPDAFERAVCDEKLGAFVLSNPCNPTGHTIRGDELAAWVRIARERDCLLILDEFYSHFQYDGDAPAAGPVSGASHVVDVERDPIVLVDGLTKSFRYPGWRVGWVMGPSELVDTLGRAASAIDGGPSMPVQRAAMQILEPARADQETDALRRAFSKKRNLLVERLSALGIRIAPDPTGTFYAFGNIEALPAPLNDVEVFFRRALERKVLTVPGRFFDVNPGKERGGPSPLANWVRFSFGPPMDNLRLGLDRLEELVEDARG